MTEQNMQADRPEKEKLPLTEAQRQKRMKMIAYPLMGLLFIGSMWLIFAPSSKDREKEGKGFNTEMPTADGTGIIADKKKAYEKAEDEQKQRRREDALHDLGALFGDNAGKVDGTPDDFIPAREGGSTASHVSDRRAGHGAVRSSMTAYEDINATLGNFYERSGQDAEKEELKGRVSELEERLKAERDRKSSTEEQVALMEKSYQLAARYMGHGGNGQTHPAVAPEPSTVEESKKGKTVSAVRQVAHQVVSALGQPVSDEEFIQQHSSDRNYGFHTAVGTKPLTDKNTIAASVYGDQSVTDGQTVRLRLLEPMAVGDRIIPKNSVVVGTARIQGERLAVQITSLEYRGMVIPTELAVYDTDGQAGIFIPGSMEQNTAREIAANMGGSLGSSINISTNAGAQLASDMGKGIILGTSQYIAKKMRTVRVHLKAGYRVMLYQKPQ